MFDNCHQETVVYSLSLPCKVQQSVQHVAILKYCETFKCRGKTISCWLTADLQTCFLESSQKATDRCNQEIQEQATHMFRVLSLIVLPIYIYTYIYQQLPPKKQRNIQDWFPSLTGHQKIAEGCGGFRAMHTTLGPRASSLGLPPSRSCVKAL